MSKKREELFLRVIDDDRLLGSLGPLMHHISHYVHADTMLAWLIAHGYTGKTLLDLWRFQFNGSMMAVAQWVIAQHNREHIKPVIAGRDWVG